MASTTLMPAFLGKPVTICIVSNDYKRTLASLSDLGIGPWRIYSCGPSNTANQTYRGNPSLFTVRLCHVDAPPGGVIYTVIQPVSGASVFQDFLDKKGEGIHHIAYDCSNMPMGKRVQAFDDRGARMVQGGCWAGGYTFQIFEEEMAGICFETVECKDGWLWPEPDEWFPAKPAGEGGKEEPEKVGVGKLRTFLKLGH